ncbi:MAG: hypothetical protein OEY03_11005 [Rhizobacter sp.]|nr:hypothetical protein [Rhizobacter sp.]
MNAFRCAAALAMLASLVGPASAQPNVNIVVDGQIRPGLYGRVEIGGLLPPPLLFPQPVVIVQPPRPVPRSPIYLHVPPGHAKNWGKHCHRYSACGQPVYFVKSREYEPDYGRHYRDDRHDHWRDDRRHDRYDDRRGDKRGGKNKRGKHGKDD